MLMMRIGKVRMGVLDPGMSMPVPMRYARQDRRIMSMCMLMVLIMYVFMLMFSFIMDMRMLMLLREMQPDTERHQQPGDYQRRRHGLTQYQGQQRAKKRRNGKIGAGAGSPQMAQRHDKQRKTYPICQKSKSHRADHDWRRRQASAHQQRK